MKSYIVTEGKTDEVLLSAVLKQLLPDMDVYVKAAGSKSSAISLARSLLVKRRRPVAFVVDADTQAPEMVREQEQNFESLLGMVAEQSLWTVALFVPELESCLFRDPTFMERFFGATLTRRQRDLAEYDPRRVLLELEQQYGHVEQPNHVALMERIAAQDLTPLKQDPAIAKLLTFLARAGERSAA